MKSIIALKKSIIPSCDVDTLDKLRRIIKETFQIEGIGGYKIGFEICLLYGMPKVVEEIRHFTALPIIYDHQKAGTDIPEMGKRFVQTCKSVDAIILFPQAGPTTERAWIRAARDEGLGVIVGGEMTHHGYLFSEGGFLRTEAPFEMYRIAAEEGVCDFVVPGNKPEKISLYKNVIMQCGVQQPVFYSPGFISQGGLVKDAVIAAGENYHPIVGRAIYDAKNIAEVTAQFVQQLNF